MLGEILELEVAIDLSSKEPRAIRKALQRILGSLEGFLLQRLVKLAYPEKKEAPHSSLLTGQIANGVAKVLAMALSGDNGGVSLKFCRLVFGILQGRLETVETLYESRESSLGLLFLSGCRLGALDALGASLIHRLSVDSQCCETEVLQMECLLSFAHGLLDPHECDSEYVLQCN